MSEPKAATPAGKKLLATIGSKNIPTPSNGGFNAVNESNKNAIPFGIKGFEFDSWTVRKSGEIRYKDGKYVGAYLYMYVYGAPTDTQIIKNLGLALKEWKKASLGSEDPKGRLYSSGTYRISVSTRDDQQFTEIIVWKIK